MSSESSSFRGWFWLCAGVGLAGALLPLALGWRHLPEPMATHWGPSGAPDGAMPKAFTALVFGALVLLPALLALPRPGRPLRPSAAKLAMQVFSGSLITAVSASTVWLNWGVAEWRQAGSMSPGVVVSLVLLPLALSGAVFAVARRSWPAQADVAKSSDALPLQPGERAYWSGKAANAGMLALGVFLLMQGFVFHLMLAKQPQWVLVLLAAVHVAGFAGLELFSKIRVSVDERALTIRYGHLGWVRQRIVLERIQGSESVEAEAIEHGGWGYRGSLRLMKRAAIMIRSGAALRLDLGDGKRLVISVDDAETASRLINGFIQRRGAAPASAEGTAFRLSEG